jgi:hypothetical protein
MAGMGSFLTAESAESAESQAKGIAPRMDADGYGWGLSIVGLNGFKQPQKVGKRRKTFGQDGEMLNYKG